MIRALWRAIRQPVYCPWCGSQFWPWQPASHPQARWPNVAVPSDPRIFHDRCIAEWARRAEDFDRNNITGSEP